MKIHIRTDMEAVAGIMTGRDWLYPAGRYYDLARKLLTLEVNAAIDGFARAGFDEFHVVDGHGAGGINIELLDPRARLSRGWKISMNDVWLSRPWGISPDTDAFAFVGQHAKSGTPYSHLTHTGWWDVLDTSINGVSIGEYGQLCLLAGHMNVPVIFASGEKALAEEARALTPWVVTAVTMEGIHPGTGDDLPAEKWEFFHEGAIHLQPEASRALISERACEAGLSFLSHSESFPTLKFELPYTIVHKTRAVGANPGNEYKVVTSSPLPRAIIELFQEIEAQKAAKAASSAAK